MWEEAKAEFVERNKWNLLKEKEKEIQKSYLLGDSLDFKESYLLGDSLDSKESYLLGDSGLKR